VWDIFEGWVDDPSNPPPPLQRKNRVGRPCKRPVVEPVADEESDEADDERAVPRMRKFLYVTTVDSLMMIASNGPSLSDTAAMNAIIQEATNHWIKKMKRCPNRSNLGRAGRPKKAAPTMKLSDLLFAQSRDAERLVGVGPPICEEDENPDFEQETRAANELLEVGGRHHRAAPGGGGPVRAARRLRGRRPGLFE
jgi:hypothetical protein